MVSAYILGRTAKLGQRIQEAALGRGVAVSRGGARGSMGRGCVAATLQDEAGECASR